MHPERDNAPGSCALLLQFCLLYNAEDKIDRRMMSCENSGKTKKEKCHFFTKCF